MRCQIDEHARQMYGSGAIAGFRAKSPRQSSACRVPRASHERMSRRTWARAMQSAGEASKTTPCAPRPELVPGLCLMGAAEPLNPRPPEAASAGARLDLRRCVCELVQRAPALALPRASDLMVSFPSMHEVQVPARWTAVLYCRPSHVSAAEAPLSAATAQILPGTSLRLVCAAAAAPAAHCSLSLPLSHPLLLPLLLGIALHPWELLPAPVCLELAIKPWVIRRTRKRLLPRLPPRPRTAGPVSWSLEV